MHRYNPVEQGIPPDKAEKALILLHGRGANAEDILTLADRFNTENFFVVAPQATNNTWYPYSFLAPELTNEPWLSSAIDTVRKVIDQISVHIPKEKIYIMGFSQGACLALETTARYPARYAGIAAFSGGLIGEIVDPSKYRGDFEGTRIFIGNSDNDPHIPVVRCEESADILRSMGAEVALRIYPGMGHTVTDEEIREVESFLVSA